MLQVSDLFNEAQTLADAWTNRVGLVEMTIPKCREQLKRVQVLVVKCLTFLNGYQRAHEADVDTDTRVHFAACFGDTSDWAFWNA